MPHTPDGQLLIAPTIPPPERKDRLNSMAWQDARTPLVLGTERVILARLIRRLGRLPTVPEIAQANLDAIFDLVVYTPDRFSDEDFYQWADQTLKPRADTPISPLTGKPKGRGDCEDTAELEAALDLAVPLLGGPSMAGAVEWMPQDGLPQNHVTSIVIAPSPVFWNQATNGGPSAWSPWAWAETTIPGARIGEHPYSALARLGNHNRSITG
jgi:hypothetical protein